jgi:hypothetical protein
VKRNRLADFFKGYSCPDIRAFTGVWSGWQRLLLTVVAGPQQSLDIGPAEE